MSLDPRDLARKQFEEVIAEKKLLDEKADGIITKATLINAGLGVVPVFINVTTFMGVSALMVVWLGHLYGYNLTNKRASDIIHQIFTSLNRTTLFMLGGTKFLAEILKVFGIGTAGASSVVGCVMDAGVCGAATYAIGNTSKEFFRKNQKMSKEEIQDRFNKSYKDGKQKVNDMRK
jgi:uncharacterized protein (DUF697 family)